MVTMGTQKLNMLARHAALKRCYYYYYLRRLSGQSVQEYLQSLTEVACEVGGLSRCTEM